MGSGSGKELALSDNHRKWGGVGVAHVDVPRRRKLTLDQHIYRSNFGLKNGPRIPTLSRIVSNTVPPRAGEVEESTTDRMAAVCPKSRKRRVSQLAPWYAWSGCTCRF